MRISDWSSDVCSSDLTLCARSCQAVRLERRTRPRLHPADDRLLHLSRHGEGRAERASAEEAGRLFPAAQDRRRMVADGFLFGDLRRFRRPRRLARSEEHTSELQSLMRISYAVFCLKKKNHKQTQTHNT